MSNSEPNFLKYSELEYNDILLQIQSKIDADSRFSNTKESASIQMLAEIFAGCTDLINYYLQRRAEEVYIDTAKLRSSVILLARQLGYVITRPIPAKANLKIVLEGDFTDLVIGADSDFVGGESKIQIPVHSRFIYEDFNFILKKTFSYTLTQNDVNRMIEEGSDFRLEISADDDGYDIELAQGEIKDKVIDGNSNPFIGQKFQTYKIEDKTFSDIYGSEDFSPAITKVWVGNNKNDANEFSIDRRSLINWENMTTGGFVQSATKNICVLRTSVDEDVEIVFGDDRYASLGPKTTHDNVYIQYLSTRGSEANKMGVVDKELQFDGVVYTSKPRDITNRIKFLFDSNITGGADLESIDSIKFGAPAMYYTLERLVSKQDYINFLKTIVSPIVIKNAIAWGEQDEIIFRDNNQSAIKKLFNVVLYTCIGSLYQTDSSPYSMKKSLYDVVLDNDFDENSLSGQSYYNVYVKNNIVEQLKTYEVSDYKWVFDGSDEPITDISYYKGQYNNSTIEVIYSSDHLENRNGTQGRANIEIDFNIIDSVVRHDAMIEIADQIQSGLRNIIDNRGGSLATNNNYGQTAFPNAECVYNGYKFVISTPSTDPCYIQNFSSETISDVSLVSDLGFGSSRASKINTGETTEIELSNKITDITDKLDKRGQVTTRHIYVSPIIHTFDIVGQVNIKPLYDKLKVKSEVENSIYSWLDLNADFNTNIYKSNIIEIIEKHIGVRNVNLEFNPVGSDIEINNPYADVIRTLDGTEYSSLSSGINNAVDDVIDDIEIFTERNFITDIVSAIYNFSNSNGLDELYIKKIINIFYKYYLVNIRNALLDESGNIVNYTMGNEIVKLNCKLEYVY